MENPDLVLQETGSRPTYSRLNYVPSGDTLRRDAISSILSGVSFIVSTESIRGLAFGTLPPWCVDSFFGCFFLVQKYNLSIHHSRGLLLHTTVCSAILQSAKPSRLTVFLGQLLGEIPALRKTIN